MSQEDFEKSLRYNLSVGKALLHLGFEMSDGCGQIDSVHKAVQWVLSKGPNYPETLHRLCAIAIKENCKDSQDLLLKGGLDINGKKAFTVEELFLMCINADDSVRLFNIYNNSFILLGLKGLLLSNRGEFYHMGIKIH
jgi:hypothetical protein